MGTIVPRPRKNGTIGYLAKISIMRDGAVHRENKTFDREKAAAAWIVKREEELNQPGAIERANVIHVTLGDGIDKYVSSSLKEIGRSKAQVLNSIKTYPIAQKAADKIESQDIVGLGEDLLKTGIKPQTVGNYISHLAAVFAIARPAWKIPLDYQAIEDATAVMKRLGYIKKSDERSRRPTLEEMDAIMTHFEDREKRVPDMAPMTYIVPFAVFSTRRQDEISRIRWDDFDEGGKRVLVRDMKNPGEKKGNDVWCDLPQPAIDIIKAMPRVREEIFPYNAASISASFTKACTLLGINTDETPDEECLRFHDLRHDGVSRLFEMGAGIPQAAAVSGHRSWSSLKRYSHIRQSGDKYAGWKWLAHVAKPARAGSRPISKRSKVSRGLPLD
ncbi:site-specific integrase [Rhizobium sp. RMa-01]|uniref:site-specific integrase n=1 Tax=unclassified Rhizobium TaxID=2613769 RepID=UPI0008DA828D|nr:MULTISPECIES: site-specific integrase [unclassified Rhizobium]OHV24967.1 integrase [Rhizobium sp. RSm-3]RVU08326.1 site-specific integrase [Rhizobium sp. RMa-01]